MDMKLEAQLIQEHLKNLELLDKECREELPEAYYDQIAHHWFKNIGPDKTMEYGVTAWQRLGAKGVAGQLSGCFYRWTRMIYRGLTISDPPMFNAVVDAFGYSMLLHCTIPTTLIRYQSQPVLPRIDHEIMLDRLWYGEPELDGIGNMGVITLRMAFRMWLGASVANTEFYNTGGIVPTNPKVQLVKGDVVKKKRPM